MDTIQHPQNVFIAAMRLEKRLPELVGTANWENIRGEFEAKSMQLLQTSLPDDQHRLAVELISLLKPYPTAIVHLNLELQTIGRQRNELKAALEQITSGYNQTALDNSVGVLLLLMSEDSARAIYTDTAGKGGAISIKASNIVPAAGTIPILNNVASVFFGANPILIALGVLVTGLSVKEGATKKIPEREASVYWGCVVAKNHERIADEAEIIRLTNSERILVGLPVLTVSEINIALEYLETEIGCIKRLNDKQWKVTEQEKIVF